MTVINGCSKFIVLGYNDSTAQIINRNTKKVTQLNLYRGKVTCLDISLNFGVVVIATEDGVITVADLYTGDTIRNIMVNFTVHQICITKTWGFIVTSSNDKSGQKFISCYTINGRFIRQKEVQSVADSIVTWSSTSGFDYIAVNLSGIVNFSEAFFLKFSPKYNRYSGKICRMEYSDKMKSLVVGYIQFKCNLVNCFVLYYLFGVLLLSSGGFRRQCEFSNNRIFSQIKSYSIYHACLHTIYIDGIDVLPLFRYRNMLEKSIF
ncbi:hypothetical protein TVAG_225450 [Trichomonas vaginalis G3]|uniref:Anaphase-promoting complex subunit 4 WD40 domain-containing protein n=1 Tax=Trichomonas vaginalis (strain ATCC PRA-98 / G3) TaxID=412133 RepID=A2DNS4_TRIV3|nr:aggrephagy protein [Trichomonas vaginalis G3]EAY17919.1 hypothetical protein TVAG_225450 [Trichomonas vaginalis G3]KAI5527093.1 aggrephagy protein [Trichomonas vaginalis G3]|eukprot:XP_001578905.1 hypothetical protein [Trichomonas vaginalis G3]